MLFLHYARQRLCAFLDQISRLSECEFPYRHSREALDELKGLFKQELRVLESFNPQSNRDVVKQECVLALSYCFEYLPVLGFILRSTNVRNAFEAFGPLLRLARDVLEETEAHQEVRLILSSEWDYSPLTYPPIPQLPGFVLIGLPAPESENPLVLPLAGHELGHLLWARDALDDEFRPRLQQGILNSIKGDWTAYRAVFSNVPDDQGALTTNMRARESWEPAIPWALHQAQETFCDFVGLRLFGRAYLSAFAYLLSPNHEGERSEFYPSMLTRVASMLCAAGSYDVDSPEQYADLFEDDSQPNLVAADNLRLALADEALAGIVDALINKARDLIDTHMVPLPCIQESGRIAEQMRKVSPAEGTKTLADILNAAWELYEDPDLWADHPQILNKRERVLREVVLKNVEVFEIEQRLNADQ